MDRRFFVLAAPLAIAGCSSTGQSVRASDEAVRAAFTPGSAQKTITLYTMRNVGSGSGAHSALAINASQRVLFDPAGSFKQSTLPERDDVLFGITPQVEALYASFHARASYYIERQVVNVPPQVAELALQRALAHGPVAQSFCTRAVSAVLTGLPGFAPINSTFWPVALRDKFQMIPGVQLSEIRETDSDDKARAAAEIEAVLTAGQ